MIKEATELPSKSEYYKSFKLSMSYNDREVLLDPYWWPEGVYVRKFFNFKNSFNNNYNNVNYKENEIKNTSDNTYVRENKLINDDSAFDYVDLC